MLCCTAVGLPQGQPTTGASLSLGQWWAALSRPHPQELPSRPPAPAPCSSDIPLELCLTSNVVTQSVAGYRAHHFSAFHGSGEGGRPQDFGWGSKQCSWEPRPEGEGMSTLLSDTPPTSLCALVWQSMVCAGHPVVLCTDDSGIFCTSLSREYALAASAFGLSEADLAALTLKAADYAFISEDEKAALRQRMLGMLGGAAGGCAGSPSSG